MEYKFTDRDYSTIADMIMSELVSPDYFSGRVEIIGSEGAEIVFRASLVLYRNRQGLASSADCRIIGVGEVWYDVEVLLDGISVEHDFDMEALKGRFIEL